MNSNEVNKNGAPLLSIRNDADFSASESEVHLNPQFLSRVNLRMMFFLNFLFLNVQLVHMLRISHL